MQLVRIFATLLMLSVATPAPLGGQEATGASRGPGGGSGAARNATDRPAATKGPNAAAKARRRTEFSWVSPLASTEGLPEGLRHATFASPSMGIEVGYYIYLPPCYEEGTQRYPVVYHLHGGRPGGEGKSARLAAFVDGAVRDGRIAPTIYVFPNGGPVSWYDMQDRENALGESVFVKELLPHIDETYRTWGSAAGRALEGYSQGGRGTTRILFRHPELFQSVAPGGSGYGNERRVQENEGYESATLRFLPIGYNTWDLARDYAARESRLPVHLLLWDGTECFNYESNLAFSAYLDELGIAHEFLAIPEVAHTAVGSYEVAGDSIMAHHQRVFDAHRERAENDDE